MLNLIKKRIGIAEGVKAYDEDINSYLADCREDLIASGVPQKLAESKDDRVVTAATLYVKAYLGNDRTDTEEHMKLYRQKVFRLTIEPEEDEVCGTKASP